MNSLERNIMFLANFESVMAVNDDAVPSDNRVAAALGENTLLQAAVFVFSKWRNEALKIVVNL